MNWFDRLTSASRQRREQQAFQLLYKQHTPQLFRRLLAKGYASAVAEEAIHEACLVYWERFHAPIVRGEEVTERVEAPFFWLLRVAQRKAIDAHRRAATAQDKQEQVEHHASLSHNTKGHEEALATRDLLLQALEQVSERDAALLLLREVEGMSYDEIASQLSMERGSVGTLLRRARKAFLQSYERLDDHKPQD